MNDLIRQNYFTSRGYKLDFYYYKDSDKLIIEYNYNTICRIECRGYSVDSIADKAAIKLCGQYMDIDPGSILIIKAILNRMFGLNVNMISERIQGNYGPTDYTSIHQGNYTAGIDKYGGPYIPTSITVVKQVNKKLLLLK